MSPERQQTPGAQITVAEALYRLVSAAVRQQPREISLTSASTLATVERTGPRRITDPGAEPGRVVVVGLLQVQLQEDGRRVLGHGAFGDGQTLPDRGVGPALGDEAELAISGQFLMSVSGQIPDDGQPAAREQYERSLTIVELSNLLIRY